MNETLLKKLAKPMLILAPVIWGSSFVVMKHSLDSFTPFYLLAFRFTAAAVLLGLVCWKSWRAMDRSYLKSGLVIGTFLFLAYAFQTFGLDRTTSGKNAFLTAVYCVIVPFLYWLIARRRPDKWNILAAFICIAGIGMVALTTKGSGGLAVNLGDMLTLAGGFFFAAHIVAVNKFAEGARASPATGPYRYPNRKFARRNRRAYSVRMFPSDDEAHGTSRCGTASR